jgi:hypothetical protein
MQGNSTYEIPQNLRVGVSHAASVQTHYCCPARGCHFTGPFAQQPSRVFRANWSFRISCPVLSVRSRKPAVSCKHPHPRFCFFQLIMCQLWRFRNMRSLNLSSDAWVNPAISPHVQRLLSNNPELEVRVLIFYTIPFMEFSISTSKSHWSFPTSKTYRSLVSNISNYCCLLERLQLHLSEPMSVAYGS